MSPGPTRRRQTGLRYQARRRLLRWHRLKDSHSHGRGPAVCARAAVQASLLASSAIGSCSRSSPMLWGTPRAMSSATATKQLRCLRCYINTAPLTRAPPLFVATPFAESQRASDQRAAAGRDMLEYIDSRLRCDPTPQASAMRPGRVTPGRSPCEVGLGNPHSRC